MTLIRDERCQLAERLAREAGTLGLAYFNNLDVLEIDRKGHQDLVSEADKALEQHIRTGITAAFPQDAILGEEDGYAPGDTAYVWVIDPIDGTANFVSRDLFVALQVRAACRPACSPMRTTSITVKGKASTVACGSTPRWAASS